MKAIFCSSSFIGLLLLFGQLQAQPEKTVGLTADSTYLLQLYEQASWNPSDSTFQPKGRINYEFQPTTKGYKVSLAYGESFNFTSNTWELNRTIASTFDPHGVPLSREDERPGFTKSVTTYTDFPGGRRGESLIFVPSAFSDTLTRASIVIDSMSNCGMQETSFAANFNIQGEEPRPISRQVIQRDLKGNVLSDQEFGYISSRGGFMPIYQRINEYTSFNKILSSTSYLFDLSGNSGATTRTIYEYDEQENVKEAIFQTNSSSEWQDITRERFIYNNQNQLVLKFDEVFSNGEWRTSFRNEYEYDVENRLMQERYYTIDNNGVTKIGIVQDYVFHPSGMLAQKIRFFYSDVQNQRVKVDGSKETFVWTSIPRNKPRNPIRSAWIQENPLSQNQCLKLAFDGSKDYEIKFTDVAGKTIFRRNTQESLTIPLLGLLPGIYVLMIYENGQLAHSQKIRMY